MRVWHCLLTRVFHQGHQHLCIKKPGRTSFMWLNHCIQSGPFKFGTFLHTICHREWFIWNNKRGTRWMEGSIASAQGGSTLRMPCPSPIQMASTTVSSSTLCADQALGSTGAGRLCPDRCHSSSRTWRNRSQLLDPELASPIMAVTAASSSSFWCRHSAAWAGKFRATSLTNA
jgi:hypothetical protein